MAIPLLAVAVLTLVRPAAAQDHPVQTWQELELQRPLTERVNLEADGELRFGGAFRDLLQGRAGLVLAFEPTSYFRLSPGYLLIKERGGTQDRTITHRLRLDGTLDREVRGVEVSNRHRIERADLQSGGSTWYRTRLQAQRAFTLWGRSFAPFVADEVFYEWSEGAWTRNRFAAGLGIPLGPRRAAEIYYLLQHDLDGARPPRQVLGVTWTLELPGPRTPSSTARDGHQLR